jgi:hypothetical protein
MTLREIASTCRAGFRSLQAPFAKQSPTHSWLRFSLHKLVYYSMELEILGKRK